MRRGQVSRSKELAGIMTVDEDMAQGLADKLRRPGGVFNGIAFTLKYFIPGNPEFMWLRILPSAEFPGSDPEYLAGAFLGKTANDSFIYNIDHSLFDLLFKMAV